MSSQMNVRRKRSAHLRSIRNGVRIVILFLLAVAFVFPFAWMILMSLKSKSDIFIIPPSLRPSTLTLDNFKFILRLVESEDWANKLVSNTTILKSMLNSAMIAVSVTVGALFTSSLAAYAFAKIRFRFKNVLFILLLATLMVPQQVTLIPMYIVMRKLGWVNTFYPLIIPGIFVYPYGVFMLRQFFATIPDAFAESAKIEGAGQFRIWWNIMLPMAKPAIITLLLFRFMGSWNEFLAPMIYLNDAKNFTITLFIYSFKTAFGSSWNYLITSAVIGMVPLLVLFLIGQRFFIEGITMGGIKS